MAKTVDKLTQKLLTYEKNDEKRKKYDELRLQIEETMKLDDIEQERLAKEQAEAEEAEKLRMEEEQLQKIAQAKKRAEEMKDEPE